MVCDTLMLKWNGKGYKRCRRFYHRPCMFLTQSNSYPSSTSEQFCSINSKTEQNECFLCAQCNSIVKKETKFSRNNLIWISSLRCFEAKCQRQNMSDERKHCDICEPFIQNQNVNRTIPVVTCVLVVDANLQEEVTKCLSQSFVFSRRYIQYLKFCIRQFASNTQSQTDCQSFYLKLHGQPLVVFVLLKQILPSLLDYNW